MVVTGAAASIAVAQRRAYNSAGNILIPNARYRDDIGRDLINSDFEFLKKLGILGS